MKRKEIIEFLLKNPDDTGLFSLADEIRRKHCSNEVHLRGLIEFSNICRKNCLYCGIRRDNDKTVRYRMSENEIMQTAIEAEMFGLKTIVLQSGEDGYFNIHRLSKIVSAIKNKTSLSLTLSVGELAREDYRILAGLGVDRFFMRFETSNWKLFLKVKKDSSYTARFERLRWMAEAGLEVGSGIMVGLPGQTIESLAQDILLFKDLNLDMIGIGPFIAHPHTPLSKYKRNNFNLALRVLAVTRIICENVHMPAASAMETANKDGRKMALLAGANVLMPNLTPLQYKKDYLLYPGKIGIEKNFEETMEGIKNLLASIGRTVSSESGGSLKRKVL